MTNTLHRQGTLESLKKDYVVFTVAAKGVNREGSIPKIQKFMRICQKYKPVNMGDSKQGNILQDDIDIEKLIANQKEGAGATACFADLDTVATVVKELIDADIGLSINISGLLEGVQDCCRRNGIERHSVEQSLGFWGATDRLPEREVLDFNSMCGHGMVSFNLIRKLFDLVKLKRLTPKKAAVIMGKCCECGVFNTDRAERLLEKVRTGVYEPRKKP
jgi:hypothetical protein